MLTKEEMLQKLADAEFKYEYQGDDDLTIAYLVACAALERLDDRECEELTEMYSMDY